MYLFAYACYILNRLLFSLMGLNCGVFRELFCPGGGSGPLIHFGGKLGRLGAVLVPGCQEEDLAPVWIHVDVKHLAPVF